MPAEPPGQFVVGSSGAWVSSLEVCAGGEGHVAGLVGAWLEPDGRFCAANLSSTPSPVEKVGSRLRGREQSSPPPWSQRFA